MWKLRILGVVSALASLLAAGPAGAVTIGFSPAVQSGGLGSSLSFDVVVFELDGEIVSSYDLDLIFDVGVLQADEVLFTSALGDPDFGEVLVDFDLGTPGLVDLSALSLLDDADLLALQAGDTVTLAILYFTVVGPGTSSIDFVFDALNVVTGANAAELDLTAVSGSAVPEPSTPSLLAAAGLFAAAVARKRRGRTR